MDFQQSIIKRYYSNNTEQDLFNETVENIYETELIYRLYPKDKYGNTIEFIPKTKFENFRSYLEYSDNKNLFYNLRLKNEKYNEQHYAEFAVDDAGNKINHRNLIYGNYNLFFNDGTENLFYKIILDNGCSSDNPFKCSFGNIECVSSQTDCECPIGYIGCLYMPYCVRYGNRDMCPDVGTKNKRVCPIGKVLCADLSCKNKYDDCYVYSYCDLRRCPDQTCASNVDDCPNTITCEKSTDYICNNNKCVESELDCV